MTPSLKPSEAHEERRDLKTEAMRAFWGLAIELKSIHGRDWKAIADHVLAAARHEVKSPPRPWPVEDLPGFSGLSQVDREDLIDDALTVHAVRLAWAESSGGLTDIDAEIFMAEAQEVVEGVLDNIGADDEEAADGEA